MKKVNGRVLGRLAYDAALSVGMKAQDFDISVRRYRDEENRRWYTLTLFFKRDKVPREATVFYGCADVSDEKTRASIKQFRWVIKHKARWLLKRRRVQNQGFYDAIWYASSLMLNSNPMVARWFIFDYPKTRERSLTILWRKEGAVFRRDMIRFSGNDFLDRPLETCEAISESIRKVSEAAANEPVPKSNPDVRRRW